MAAMMMTHKKNASWGKKNNTGRNKNVLMLITLARMKQLLHVNSGQMEEKEEEKAKHQSYL